MQDSITHGLTERDVTRIDLDTAREELTAPDTVAVEEPLEIRVNGETVAITMRTPGDDVPLSLGFLFAEGIIDSFNDVQAILDSESRSVFEEENVVDVQLREANAARLGKVAESRRGTLTTSACGVCGRKSIGDLIDRCGKLPPGPQVNAALITSCIARLRDSQLNFSRTGGVHAAAAFTQSGELLVIHEDVGRHNATDKVVGDLLRQNLIGPSLSSNFPASSSGPTSRNSRSPGQEPTLSEENMIGVSEGPTGRNSRSPGQAQRRPGNSTENELALKGRNSQTPTLIVVSGRASFELAQKTIAAGIPILASVSAASSLAIDLANACHLTLAAFARGGKFNIYSHPERLSY